METTRLRRAMWTTAAIAVGAPFVLQTAGLSFYDTGEPPSSSRCVPESHMSEGEDRNPAQALAPSGVATPPVESTFDLLQRVKSGEDEAFERLIAHFLPPLRRWASGRLPRWCRDLMDTDDLVQETVIRVLRH